MRDLLLLESKVLRDIFVQLDEMDIEYAEYLDEVKLNLHALTSFNCIVGAHSVWRFLNLISAREKRTDLGYTLGSRLPFVTQELTSDMDLGESFQFQDLVAAVSSYYTKNTKLFYISGRGNTVLLNRKPSFKNTDFSWQVEQYYLAGIISLIQSFLGETWTPDAIHCSQSREQKLPKGFNTHQIKWGCKTTAIAIPSRLLSKTIKRDQLARLPEDKHKIFHSDYSDINLNNFIRSQILMGNVLIDDAAEQLGISTSGLKKRLQKDGTNFSELLEQTRFDIALNLLKKDQYTIEEISSLLMYTHASNFTRAFTKKFGCAPTTYYSSRR